MKRITLLAALLLSVPGLISAEPRKVYVKVDGSLRVLIPSPNSRLKGEPENVWIDRIAARAEIADPSLSGLTKFDIDSAALPSRTETDSQGDIRRTRAAWRRSGVTQVVIIDRTKFLPQWTAWEERLRLVIPRSKQARLPLSAWLSQVRVAVRTKNKPLAGVLFSRLEALQAGANPPLTATEFTAVETTFTEKNIPKVLGTERPRPITTRRERMSRMTRTTVNEMETKTMTIRGR